MRHGQQLVIVADGAQVAHERDAQAFTVDFAGGSLDWDIAEPSPDALVESLRAFGYSPEAAIADLIDNSISAGAHQVDVQFNWNGPESSVLISDDGAGMEEASLLNAMRAGSRNPLEDRDESDLGRFGLGLKTASFSQARELTVVSRKSGAHSTAVRRWDLDLIAETSEWRLLRTAPPGMTATPVRGKSGTVVMWSKCDRLVGDAERHESKAHTRFNATIERVARHLAAVFHRYMTGRGKITITVNGQPLEPWDPFMTGNSATQRLNVETLTIAGLPVKISPFVLPHRSKLNPEEQSAGAGAAGWNQQQGFYIYRSNRLLVQGDWLGLGFSKEEHAKLARIAIEFPAALDHEWQVDVKKSSARAPGPLQQDLRRIATATRRAAEEVYRHRGKVIARQASQDFVMAWQQFKTRDGEVRYRINRKHPVVETLLDSSSNKRATERGLRFIEETIPSTLVGIGIADALDQQPTPFAHHRPELDGLLRFAFEGLTATGLNTGEALDRIAAAEPFIQYPEIVQAFRESLDG